MAMSTLGPGSDIDVDELMKGDAMLEDDDEDVGIEVVPIDSGMASLGRDGNTAK